MTGRQPLTLCPVCSSELDAWTPVEDGTAPRPGDVSVCAYCHAVLVYADDLTVRNPTATEMIEIIDQLSRGTP